MKEEVTQLDANDENQLLTLWLDIKSAKKKAKGLHQRKGNKALPIASALKALVCIRVAENRFVLDILYNIFDKHLFQICRRYCKSVVRNIRNSCWRFYSTVVRIILLLAVNFVDLDRQVQATLKMFGVYGKVNRKGGNFKNLVKVLFPNKSYKGQVEQECVKTKEPIAPSQEHIAR